MTSQSVSTTTVSNKTFPGVSAMTTSVSKEKMSDGVSAETKVSVGDDVSSRDMSSATESSTVKDKTSDNVLTVVSTTSVSDNKPSLSVTKASVSTSLPTLTSVCNEVTSVSASAATTMSVNNTSHRGLAATATSVSDNTTSDHSVSAPTSVSEDSNTSEGVSTSEDKNSVGLSAVTKTSVSTSLLTVTSVSDDVTRSHGALAATQRDDMVDDSGHAAERRVEPSDDVKEPDESCVNHTEQQSDTGADDQAKHSDVGGGGSSVKDAEDSRVKIVEQCGRQLVTLPAAVLSHVNPSRPISLSLVDQTITVPPTHIYHSSAGLRLLLPADSLPSDYVAHRQLLTCTLGPCQSQIISVGRPHAPLHS